MDIAMMAHSEVPDRALIDRYAEAGATWWLESIHDVGTEAVQMMARVAAGPA